MRQAGADGEVSHATDSFLASGSSRPGGASACRFRCPACHMFRSYSRCPYVWARPAMCLSPDKQGSAALAGVSVGWQVPAARAPLVSASSSLFSAKACLPQAQPLQTHALPPHLLRQ